ncbi:MAG: glutamine synthetase family protein [Aestuariivirga sp.]|uniref:glutamine synthetase family protein n=1 Tax=Aestuariivirga sp. TaxID=2650926 RepID=UPI003017E31A
MISDPLLFVATSDFAGRTRGKAFPVADYEKRSSRGVGWTPTNVMITCFDVIGKGPYGSLGDLLLVPDRNATVTIDMEDGGAVERFALGDITDLEGNPWECCTRSLLKSALERLRTLAGVELMSAFEHEFQIVKTGQTVPDAYSLRAFTKQRRMGETLMAALSAAGLQADTFMAEFGPNQFEVTNGPALAHRSADHAVFLREVTRMVAGRFSERVTFVPISNPTSVGNGVHIHMSFVDHTGAPKTYDPGGPGNMSKLTASFVAGILKYLDSIIALTAPSDVSYLRLTPHRWSAAYNNLGFRDREASVRICPVTAREPDKIQKQYNFEYRAADAAASPYLALAAIVHAGCQGIEEQLSAPEITQEDLSVLSDTELGKRGYGRLPTSLEQALQKFEANAVVRSWFPPCFSSIYTAHKRAEIAYLGDRDTSSRCAAYADVY